MAMLDYIPASVTREILRSGLVPGHANAMAELNKFPALMRALDNRYDDLQRFKEEGRDTRELEGKLAQASAQANAVIDAIYNILSECRDRGIITVSEYENAAYPGNGLLGTFSDSIPILSGVVLIVVAAVLVFVGAPVIAAIAAIAGLVAVASSLVLAMSRERVTTEPVIDPRTGQPMRDSNGNVITRTTRESNSFLGDLGETLKPLLGIVLVGGVIWGVSKFYKPKGKPAGGAE